MGREDKFEFWCEWRSWVLPLRLGVWGGHTTFEVQVGPFGFSWFR